jgi:hypothetical protein
MSRYHASFEERLVASLRRFVAREGALYAELLRRSRSRRADRNDIEK